MWSHSLWKSFRLWRLFAVRHELAEIMTKQLFSLGLLEKWTVRQAESRVGDAMKIFCFIHLGTQNVRKHFSQEIFEVFVQVSPCISGIFIALCKDFCKNLTQAVVFYNMRFGPAWLSQGFVRRWWLGRERCSVESLKLSLPSWSSCQGPPSEVQLVKHTLEHLEHFRRKFRFLLRKDSFLTVFVTWFWNCSLSPVLRITLLQASSKSQMAQSWNFVSISSISHSATSWVLSPFPWFFGFWNSFWFSWEPFQRRSCGHLPDFSWMICVEASCDVLNSRVRDQS